jgi:hypothetical protein
MTMITRTKTKRTKAKPLGHSDYSHSKLHQISPNDTSHVLMGLRAPLGNAQRRPIVSRAQ